MKATIISVFVAIFLFSANTNTAFATDLQAEMLEANFQIWCQDRSTQYSSCEADTKIGDQARLDFRDESFAMMASYLIKEQEAQNAWRKDMPQNQDTMWVPLLSGEGIFMSLP